MSDELISLARAQIDAFNAGDWDAVAQLLTEDSLYEELATGRRADGRAAILEVNKAWKAAFPDVRGEITDAFACGDRVALRITWEGTHAGPLPLPSDAEIPATDNRVVVPALETLRFEEGKVAAACHSFDMLSMFEQMGTLSADALAGRA